MSGEKEAIEEVVTKRYQQYVNEGDAIGYASLYLEDCLWSPPGGPDQTTVKGVQAAIGGLFQKSALSVEIEADEIEVLGDSAWALGTVNGVNRVKETDDSSEFKFKVLWILKKSSSEWKIFRQVWNNKPL